MINSIGVGVEICGREFLCPCTGNRKRNISRKIARVKRPTSSSELNRVRPKSDRAIV